MLISCSVHSLNEISHVNLPTQEGRDHAEPYFRNENTEAQRTGWPAFGPRQTGPGAACFTWD